MRDPGEFRSSMIASSRYRVGSNPMSSIVE
jgi:hypothetical protein